MDENNKEGRHKELNDLVTMAEACVTAFVEVEGSIAQVPGAARNRFAELLSQLVCVYTLSADRQHVRALSQSDRHGGAFRDGGREIAFTDGRAPIHDLAVTRTSLKAAIGALKEARGKAAAV